MENKIGIVDAPANVSVMEQIRIIILLISILNGKEFGIKF